MEKIRTIKGGQFLIQQSDPSHLFIPEEISEEQQMIMDTCRDFLESEVAPQLEKIEKQEDNLNVILMNKVGDLGLLGISIPEEYGGFGQDMNTSMLSTEVIGTYSSFAVSFAAHVGIGTLPILFYGNQKQKENYLPLLASGKLKGAYCLTEPGSGSDANSGKSKATLSDDGKHYLLNGQKMWITNGGFADLFTVFAKIDDDENLSAFLVEKSFLGVSLGQEEKKMGIKGSSTCMMFFENCQIPIENLLGERGTGFKIALNILNNGRIKLAAAVLGAAKKIIQHSVNYANERIQFGKTIAHYGAIQHKLAEQSIQTYAIESAIYRCSNDIQNQIIALCEGGMSKEKAMIEAQKEFAAEAAILKVAASEVLDFVSDEGVQIYGGMGYSAEAPMERYYRDSRINRIFEGTNEINRMLIVDYLLKKAFKNELPLLTASRNVTKELMAIPEFGEENTIVLAQEEKLITGFKKCVLLLAGAAAQKFMQKLSKEQEILILLSDLIIDTYVAESLLLRIQKLQTNQQLSEEKLAICKIYIYDRADRIHKNAKDAANAISQGDELRMILLGLKRFTKHSGLNSKEERRTIAKKLIEENNYCF